MSQDDLAGQGSVAAGGDLTNLAGLEPANLMTTATRAEVACRAALRNYEDTENVSIALIEVSENSTFLVILSDGTKRVMRVHREGYHGYLEIISELQWTAALVRDEGIRTPTVVSNRRGEAVTTVSSGEDRVTHCVMFEFAEGEALPPESPPDAYGKLGALSAILHRHAREWKIPPGFQRFRWDEEAAFGPNARWGRWDCGVGVGEEEAALLRRVQERLLSRLGSFGRGPDRFGLIHADLRFSNLLWSSSGDITVLDFDDCGWSWFLYDLAAAVSFIEDSPLVPGLIDAWITGYRSIAPLAPQDVAETWTFILMRRLLLLGWIGTHQSAAFARELGPTFARGTCDLGERYLNGELKVSG
ncbi:MAG: phosphotransferase enzyme family protein [Acidimicrobiales bacterium]